MMYGEGRGGTHDDARADELYRKAVQAATTWVVETSIGAA